MKPLLVMRGVPCKTKYIDEPVDIYVAEYPTGNLAIYTQAVDGEPMMDLTKNLKPYGGHLACDDEVFIKNYAENEGALHWAITARIVEQNPVMHVQCGFVTFPCHRLTQEFLGRLAAAKAAT